MHCNRQWTNENRHELDHVNDRAIRFKSREGRKERENRLNTFTESVPPLRIFITILFDENVQYVA